MSSQQNHDQPDAAQDITNALKETLRRTGTIDNVRTQLRTEIYHCLSESLSSIPELSDQKAPQTKIPNSPPIENILINEIIADYLTSNCYHSTLSVFSNETGMASLSPCSCSCNGNACIHNRHDNANNEAKSVLGLEFIRQELGLNDLDGLGTGRRNNNMTSLAMLYDIIELLKARRRTRQL